MMDRRNDFLHAVNRLSRANVWHILKDRTSRTVDKKAFPPILTSKSSMDRRAFFKSIALLVFATIVPYGLSQTSTEPAIHAESQRLPVF